MRALAALGNPDQWHRVLHLNTGLNSVYTSPGSGVDVGAVAFYCRKSAAKRAGVSPDRVKTLA